MRQLLFNLLTFSDRFFPSIRSAEMFVISSIGSAVPKGEREAFPLVNTGVSASSALAFLESGGVETDRQAYLNTLHRYFVGVCTD